MLEKILESCFEIAAGTAIQTISSRLKKNKHDAWSLDNYSQQFEWELFDKRFEIESIKERNNLKVELAKNELKMRIIRERFDDIYRHYQENEIGIDETNDLKEKLLKGKKIILQYKNQDEQNHAFQTHPYDHQDSTDISDDIRRLDQMIQQNQETLETYLHAQEQLYKALVECCNTFEHLFSIIADIKCDLSFTYKPGSRVGDKLFKEGFESAESNEVLIQMRDRISCLHYSNRNLKDTESQFFSQNGIPADVQDLFSRLNLNGVDFSQPQKTVNDFLKDIQGRFDEKEMKRFQELFGSKFPHGQDDNKNS